MTKIDLNTKINSVNVVAASVVDKLAGMGYLKQLLGKPKVEKIFQNYNTSIFFTRTVDELLFGGYNISFLIKLDKEKITKFPDQLYGLMHNKNFTYDGIWTTHTGKDNITKLGSANRWNGVSRFRPNLDTTGVDHKVNMYSSSLYRPLSMIHRQDYTFKGIKVARYEVEEQNFKLSLEHNRCYCPDKEKTIEGIQMCKFDGLLDISGCREAPIIISAPHFLYGSPELLKYFEGVHPNRSKHESYIDIDPVTGIAMKGRKRLQINVYAREWTNQFGHFRFAICLTSCFFSTSPPKTEHHQEQGAGSHGKKEERYQSQSCIPQELADRREGHDYVRRKVDPELIADPNVLQP
ncbi:hypothetical protein L1887_48779 [Cichorium endivia]|nr:hypothetical protein L1887_48779 [Cichorium endivia]